MTSKYLIGGVTGFAAAGAAYQSDGKITGTLAGLSIIVTSLLWYHVGKGEPK